MVRFKEYEDRDVVAAAAARLDTTLDGFDRLVVSFSGGKDSLVCLHLVHAAQARAGDDRPVLAVYRDEQHVNGAILDTVRAVAAQEWVDLRWVAVPQVSRTVLLGQPTDIPLWPEGAHEHALATGRLPAGAFTGDGRREWQLADVDEWAIRQARGRVGIVTGIRAAESLVRYRSVVNKLSEPWLAKSEGRQHVTLVRPIYDWSETDVLRYLEEHDLGGLLCALYDAQGWNGARDLRTASLLNVEGMRHLGDLAITDPDAYDTLVALDPRVATMRRYASDLADPRFMGAECATLDDVETWVYARFPDVRSRIDALDRVAFARTCARSNPHGFPAWWVQAEIARQGHGKGMQPLPQTHPRYGQRPPVPAAEQEPAR